jgi:transcriptional regulator with XRE-family HTH domain
VHDWGEWARFPTRIVVADNFNENLRFMVWKREPNRRENWRGLIANWAEIDQSRALSLIHGAKPSEQEIRRISDKLNLEQETLLYSRVLNSSEILFRNIDYLFDGLDHGLKGEYAESLGVDLSTVSRWRRGKARPTRFHLHKLCAKFLIEPDVDLEEIPLFLAPMPISLGARRQWLKAKIDGLSPTEMNELFPALRRLLGDVDGVD